MSYFDLTSNVLVLTRTEDWYVNTCDGSFKKLSYKFYLDPYDLASWIAILTSVGTLTLFILAVMLVVDSFTPPWNVLYNLLTTGFGVLIGIAPNLRQETRTSPVILRYFMVTFNVSDN